MVLIVETVYYIKNHIMLYLYLITINKRNKCIFLFDIYHSSNLCDDKFIRASYYE